MGSMPEVEALRLALAEPFEAGEVKFKPQSVSGNRALAVPYVDARVVMDRLDDVFGVGGWQTSYRASEHGVICQLAVKVNGEWVTHEDVGGESEQPDEGDREKAAFSDALKRVAVHLGIGRYLYRAGKQWCDYDPQKRQFTSQPKLPGAPRAKPAPAPAAAQPPPAPAAPQELPQKSMWELANEYEAKMVAAGLCAKGELAAWLVHQLNQQLGPKVYEWPLSAKADVTRECQAYRAQREAAVAKADEDAQVPLRKRPPGSAVR